METGRNEPIFNKKDRISILPDDLIHHILSFIDMKYAIQSCILSRRWRYIWTSLSTLNFNAELYYCDEKDNYNDFIDFVDKVLILRDNSDIKRFHLDWQDTQGSRKAGVKITRRLNNTWILVAVKRNVQELCIKGVSHDRFEIPPSLTTCKSLTILELDMFGDDIVLPNTMSLSRLKYMRLDSLLFHDEELTNMFFSSCHALEYLIICYCQFWGCMDINISSLTLKHIEVLQYKYPSRVSFKLYAPNLTYFRCSDGTSPVYSLENLSSLVTADIDIYNQESEEELYERTMKFLIALHKVKDLTLSHLFIKVFSRAPEIFDNQPLLFLNLQCLKLNTWLSRDWMNAIMYLLKISPNIESLSLVLYKRPYDDTPYPFCDEIKYNSGSTGDYWEVGLSFPWMLHHLKFVEIQGILGCVIELNFLEILLKNAMVLEEVVLCSYFSETRMMKFRDKILSFPRASTSIEFKFEFEF